MDLEIWRMQSMETSSIRNMLTMLVSLMSECTPAVDSNDQYIWKGSSSKLFTMQDYCYKILHQTTSYVQVWRRLFYWLWVEFGGAKSHQELCYLVGSYSSIDFQVDSKSREEELSLILMTYLAFCVFLEEENI